VFTGVGSNNEIKLSKFPFVNYEIINSTGYFYNDGDLWIYNTPQNDITSGHVLLYPTIVDSVGNIVQTGSRTGQIVTGLWGSQSGLILPSLTGDPGISNSYFGSIDGIAFGYFIKVMDSSNYTEIASFASASQFILNEPVLVSEEQIQQWDAYSTGNVLSGSISSPVSGYLRAEYTIGVGVKTDNQIYAISDVSYSPIRVTVGGNEAENITNYATLQHPAFSIANTKDNDYQYIHAGNTLYFNQKIDKEIKVTYNWITEYLRVLGTLRCNVASNPDLTPRVNAVKIFINNLVI
jgi:hypothetical protein